MFSPEILGILAWFGCISAHCRTFWAVFSAIFSSLGTFKVRFTLHFLPTHFPTFFPQKSLESHWILGPFLFFSADFRSLLAIFSANFQGVFGHFKTDFPQYFFPAFFQVFILKNPWNLTGFEAFFFGVLMQISGVPVQILGLQGYFSVIFWGIFGLLESDFPQIFSQHFPTFSWLFSPPGNPGIS